MQPIWIHCGLSDLDQMLGTGAAQAQRRRPRDMSIATAMRCRHSQRIIGPRHRHHKLPPNSRILAPDHSTHQAGILRLQLDISRHVRLRRISTQHRRRRNGAGKVACAIHGRFGAQVALLEPLSQVATPRRKTGLSFYPIAMPLIWALMVLK